jgi:hypothetical protein
MTTLEWILLGLVVGLGIQVLFLHLRVESMHRWLLLHGDIMRDLGSGIDRTNASINEFNALQRARPDWQRKPGKDWCS